MAFTFFFRDRFTLEHLAELIAPDFNTRSKVKIWDAGCAMGPEPYTFGIILHTKIGSAQYRKTDILASDIDETEHFGTTVANGIYPHSDLVRIPEEAMRNYFAQVEDGNYEISREIRSSVRFLKHDLLTIQPPENSFSAVICKNVLLHFTYEQRLEVIKMFWNTLVPGGFLVMEQTQQFPDELTDYFQKAASDANIYQKI